MPSTLSPQEFVAKWRQVSVKERSAAQSHFNDLCTLLGVELPLALATPDGVRLRQWPSRGRSEFAVTWAVNTALDAVRRWLG